MSETTRDKAELEREALRSRWPDEFRDGARCGLLREYPGDRERGGYPRGFHQWPLERRNACTRVSTSDIIRGTRADGRPELPHR
jgi:hypothetical protein